MQRVRFRIFAASALLLAVLLVAFFRRGNAIEGGPAQNSPPQPRSPRSAETSPKSESSLRGSVPGSRAQQLADLKKRWLRIGEPLLPGDYSKDDLAYRQELSKESARLLLCSEEAVELVQFLEKEGIYNGVESSIRDLFGTDLGKEARQTLISLPDTLAGDGTRYRQLWSASAGEGCPPEEFAEFCSALGSPTCVQEAVFGQNVAIARTDPEKALALTLAQIEKDENSRTKNGSVKNLIKELPPGTDFEKIYEMLPALEATDSISPFFGLRSAFIQTWSKSDPAAAVNFVIDHSDQFPVSDITAPVMDVVAKDPEAGMAWIETFPSGPYFDAAAGIGITRLIRTGHPKEAERLASKISDPEARRSLMEAALKPPGKYSESK